jgi:hypothetical protein
VAEGELVTLKGRREALKALARGLSGFGPSKGEPQWLVSAVWLCAGDQRYLATASAEVLPDGFVARSLCIGTPDDLARHLEAELPNVSAHLLARGNGQDLPPAEAPEPPDSLGAWTHKRYATHVLVRSWRRASCTHRVVCGLRFTGDDGRTLLVGTDPSVLAMVLSEDPELIGRYCKDCEALTPDEYLRLCG